MKFSKPVSKDFTNASQLASNAQSTANNALANATQAIGSADGKNTNYFGTDHTTQNGVNGDLYYQTNADKTVSMYQYNNGWQLIASDAAGVNFGATNLVYNSNYSNNAYGWNTFGIGYLSNTPLSMYNGSQGFGLNISGQGTNTWTKFGESKHVSVPTTTVDSVNNVFSFSAMVKIYEHSAEATVVVVLAFFDSNGNRISPWQNVTVHNDISDGQSTIWQKASFDGFAYPNGAVTMAIQYFVYGDTMHAMVANPIITQTSAAVPYHSGQTTIKADNIIGGTFDGARANLININAASISTGTLNANSVSINSSTGKVDQYQGDVPWMPWKWDSSTFTISNGFISTTAKNAVSPGEGFTANAVGTYSPTYLKLTLWSTDGAKEYGRSYLDGSGLYVGAGSNQTIVGPNSVESDSLASKELDAGNLALVANTIYNTQQRDIYFTYGYVGTRYSGHAATIHASVVNASTLSAKTDLQKLDEQDAINALKNIDEYSYQYIGDAESGSKQRYISGIIDDVNDVPQYKIDPLFVYEGGQDRVDSNLLNVQTVVIQNLLKRVESLEKAQTISA